METTQRFAGTKITIAELPQNGKNMAIVKPSIFKNGALQYRLLLKPCI